MHEMYRELVLDHARNPRYQGLLEPCDIDHEEHNPLCGDYLHVTMRLDDFNRVVDIAWEGEGCVISQASASILSEHIVGKTLSEITEFSVDDLMDLLKIPVTPNRMKCATLALKTIVVGAHGVEAWKRIKDGKHE